MAFYQPVTPGDAVSHSARRENDISALLNRFGGISAVNAKPGAADAFRLAVYNSTSEEIPAGTALEIDPEKKISGDALPVKPANRPAAFYLVTAEKTPPNRITSAVLMGVVTVRLAAALPAGTQYVAPDGTGKFNRAAGGCARVLAASDAAAIVLLGGSAAGYTGSFAVTQDAEGLLKVGPGWLNRNGIKYDYITMAGGGIKPKNGYLCITSRPIDKKGEWSDPECEILDNPSQLAFPLAQITVEETSGRKTVAIRQFPVTVATILYSVRCPIAEL
ncbi:hypothetical protein HF882_06870 [Victivallis vadensis]|uniref:Uncharacterized protein n=1 Tax=Victivallis vadensis TaxID=172901 RepID=A0A848ASF9_9BACT|nr:hypothetical protein [Victivallis vadensis]NMD86305.1 hypothetical protein [Victivallis vadensis]